MLPRLPLRTTSHFRSCSFSVCFPSPIAFPSRCCSNKRSCAAKAPRSADRSRCLVGKGRGTTKADRAIRQEGALGEVDRQV